MEREVGVGMYLELIFIAFTLGVLWYLKYRYGKSSWMPSLTILLITSLLLVIWCIAALLNTPWKDYVVNVFFVFAVAAAILNIINRSKESSLRETLKETFKEEYGFRGFVYLMVSGFVFFVITALLNTIMRIKFFVYFFGIIGIAAVVTGCCGMIYGFVRFYGPMIFKFFKKDE
jgi:hypothetical protein